MLPICDCNDLRGLKGQRKLHETEKIAFALDQSKLGLFKLAIFEKHGRKETIAESIRARSTANKIRVNYGMHT